MKQPTTKRYCPNGHTVEDEQLNHCPECGMPLYTTGNKSDLHYQHNSDYDKKPVKQRNIKNILIVILGIFIVVEAVIVCHLWNKETKVTPINKHSDLVAKEQGFGGDVTAYITLDEDKIQSLNIDASNETPGLGQRASESAFTKQFIGKSGPFFYGENGIEALTGATVTSRAALKAINKAIGKEIDESALVAKEQGFGGDLTVYITLDEDKIQSLIINTPNETAGLGQRASESAFTKQFIGKSGPFFYGENGIEALTGATLTSEAALKAINKAIGKEIDESALVAKEQGFGGDVTAYITLDEDKIQSLIINTPNETAGLGQRASESAFTKQFIGKSGPFFYGENGIEALTGATLTSEAALKAINKAIGAEMLVKTESKKTKEIAEESTKTKDNANVEEFNGQTYNAYRVTKENAFSKITVTAFVKNRELIDVKITSNGYVSNSDLLTDKIKKEWARAILESGSAEPDAITSSTLKFSANSVVEAMTDIIMMIKSSADGTSSSNKVVEATEPGFIGDVTVYITLDGDKIKSLTIDEPNEIEYVVSGNRISDDEFIKQFIGKSGPFSFRENGIEAISGATVTCEAALKAINKAIGTE